MPAWKTTPTAQTAMISAPSWSTLVDDPVLAWSVWLAPMLAGLAGTLAIEALLAPRPSPFWKRGVAAGTLHLGSWWLLFGAGLLLLQRPWFCVVTVLSLQMVVIQSSNTKSHTLNEPFICHDFEYFLDAIRHPRLYVPFFGIRLAVGASLAGLIAIAAFFLLEPSISSRAGWGALLIAAGLPGISGGLLIAAGLSRLPPPTLCPQRDMHSLGLYASLWAYGTALWRAPPLTPAAAAFSVRQTARLKALPTAQKPHVVLVQSESFCDPRRWCPDTAPGLLSQWDTALAYAQQHGELDVPAWGANTVRTECATLTGIAPGDWGIYQFNPYHQLKQSAYRGLAEQYRQAGYHTVCVHPYPAGFYFRHRVMPHLGFDTFIDISAFDSTDYDGQYVSDAAVARHVDELLGTYRSSGTPVFIFAITMENHGPLELEPLQRETLAHTLPHASWPPSGHQRNLAVYLRHLKHADAMLNSLKNTLEDAGRPGVLGFYGDHVPILPEAYAHYAMPSGKTPYMIWSTRQAAAPENALGRHDISAHQLGHALLWHSAYVGQLGPSPRR